MITLHYVATANGLKIAIALEEMALEYEVIDYPLFEGRHLTVEFRQLNPNCKLPVLVDKAPDFADEPVTIFESGAMLLYLAEKSGQFLPAGESPRWEVLKWLIWQVAGHGPMNGQAHHFLRYAPEGEDYGVTRYVREVVRLLNVLEYRLAEADYLGGSNYSIADMAAWPWVQASWLLDVDLASFPAVSRWSQVIAARPAVIRATSASATAIPTGNTQGRARLSDAQWSNMFGDNLHRAATLRRD
ncbi:glutathione S-transferase C-terminal domain-containing protein [Sphingosinicella soli]|uniref:GST-like protein n=1 Tax=Sphingosinicella soli TaxID=333708 RepID=A0A7W7B076_9SPHN|nr:glutathione S-transferase C-terminal domain-containing protein [Sphingosinicella soli]MBB4631618.1 GST-like protein [Sphingosinicella soli]